MIFQLSFGSIAWNCRDWEQFSKDSLVLIDIHLTQPEVKELNYYGAPV